MKKHFVKIPALLSATFALLLFTSPVPAQEGWDWWGYDEYYGGYYDDDYYDDDWYDDYYDYDEDYYGGYYDEYAGDYDYYADADWDWWLW